MVTDALISWFVAAVVALIGWLPELPEGLSDGMESATAALEDMADKVADWGFVVPFTEIGLALGIWLAGFIVAGAVRLARIVASFATLGGGM